MKKTAAVAVIGAGLSGLSCAQALRAAGANVRVFEGSNAVGGRCATRLWQGHLVDYGVQYFTAQSNEFKKELLTSLRQFRPIISPVLDRDNNVVNSEAGPRFYVLQGNNYFAHVLSHGLDLRLHTPVETLTSSDAGVECMGETYRAVVCAVPGPVAARILGLSRPTTDYAPCITAMLEYAGAGIGNSRECYARLLPEGKEPLLSSYCENNKAGRVVGDKSVFVVQATPKFSRENAYAPSEEYLPPLMEEHEKIWNIPAGKCTASSGHLWTYGLPSDEPRRRVDLPTGVFSCGDSRADSNVESVWIDGRRAAAEVLSYLASQ